MRAAMYARVSTMCHGQSPERQLRELRDYCRSRGWETATEYVDIGQSGAKDSRPELNRLMADAHQRKFDVVLTWKLDRFGRSLRHLVNALADLEARGVLGTRVARLRYRPSHSCRMQASRTLPLHLFCLAAIEVRWPRHQSPRVKHANLTLA